MKSSVLVFMAALLCAGCATVDERQESLLSQADAKLIAEDYSGAMASYAEFAAAQPKHAQAARAQATQKALERLAASQTAYQAASQAAINRAQQGSDATRRELTERQAETDRLKGEIAKLRADFERLRSIDLQLQKK